jgi:GxxExxY protein
MLINPKHYEHITGAIIASSIDVHRELGPGLLESPYVLCLQYELTSRNLQFHAQRTVPVIYRGITLDTRCRIDLIVEDQVIVEVKSVDAILPVHRAQLLTYLRLANCPVGLIVNFNVPVLKDGVKRVLNPALLKAGVTNFAVSDENARCE